jgi:hypothetical protein
VSTGRTNAIGSDGIVDLLRETADGVGRLIRDHVHLARVEVVTDARRFGRRSAWLIVFAPLALAGWGTVGLAAAAYLAPRVGAPAALLLVGGVQLAIGALGIAVVARRLRRRPAIMNGTAAAETKQTLNALAAAATSLPAAAQARAVAPATASAPARRAAARAGEAWPR